MSHICLLIVFGHKYPSNDVMSQLRQLYNVLLLTVPSSHCEVPMKFRLTCALKNARNREQKWKKYLVYKAMTSYMFLPFAKPVHDANAL